MHGAALATLCVASRMAVALQPAIASRGVRFVARRASVTGVAYTGSDGAPLVEMYTKEGCTLCDEAKEVLMACRNEAPHSLHLVDITDADKSEWWDRYKYDIPVLHIERAYWTKHRLTAAEALQAIAEAAELKAAGKPFEPRTGQPDAARLERA